MWLLIMLLILLLGPSWTKPQMDLYKVIQWKKLNGITLEQRETDNTKWMICTYKQIYLIVK